MNNVVKDLNNSDKLRPSDFPPNLQILAETYIDIIDDLPAEDFSLKKLCEIADVNYKSARQQIYITKERKRLDFYTLLNDLKYAWLKSNIHVIDGRLYERALEGSHRHMETFYRRTKVFEDQPQIQINQQFNTLIAPPGNLPDLEEQDPDTTD